MAFQFVENDKIDAKSRKLIRSHVMKGKNAGKTRRRPPTTKDSDSSTPSSNTDEVAIISSTSSSDDSRSSNSPPTTIARPLGDDLAYFTLPITLDLPARNLISHFMYIQMEMIYPVAFCFRLDWMRSKWFEYLQSSETFLHCSQLMATIMVDGLLGKPSRSPQALKHLANTYRCFNRDLKRQGTPSDPDMAVVVSLAVHENLDAQFGVSAVHLKALQRMLELRGGIERFGEENWVLWHKICRADIDRALHEGSTTMFYRSALPHLASKSTANALSIYPSPSPAYPHLSTSTTLLAILADMTTLSHLLDANPSRFSLTPSTFQGALITFAYRLLQSQPLTTVPDDGLENALHITALGWLTTILFEYGRLHARGYDLLASRLRNAISSVMTTIQLKEQPVLLWILFAGGIALFGDEDEGWLSPCVRSCAAALGVGFWEDCVGLLVGMPWIRVVHDRPGRVVWEAAMGKKECGEGRAGILGDGCEADVYQN